MEFWLPGVTKLKKVMAGVKLTWSLGRWSNNKHTHMFHNMAYMRICWVTATQLSVKSLSVYICWQTESSYWYNMLCHCHPNHFFHPNSVTRDDITVTWYCITVSWYLPHHTGCCCSMQGHLHPWNIMIFWNLINTNLLWWM